MTDTERTTVSVVTALADLPENTMKMVVVGETRVALIRTSTGVYALDNACPHQGYGLVTGALKDDTLTCQWHNWKYDVTDGRCIVGEENVACHQVTVDDAGAVSVAVTRPTDAEQRARLWPSLRRGLAADYVGQIARDTVRLLDAGATPGDIMTEAMAMAAPKTDYGVGHEVAMAADCLALAEVRTGDERVLPLVQGLSGLAEETRDRPVAELPPGDAGIDLVTAIETQDHDGAVASVVGQLEAGVELADLRRQLLVAVSAHHLSYGHGIIYTQKTFELLDRIGHDRALDLLPHLVTRIVHSTREDTLPYMRKAVRAIDAVDLDRLATAADRRSTGWNDRSVTARFLAAPEAPIEESVAAVHDGAGIEGLLDTISTAVSYRLLEHDLDVELDSRDPFGWLDITHGLTTARAVRWAWRAEPGPHTARLALFAAWLLFDTGRSERRRAVAERWLDGFDRFDDALGVAGRPDPADDLLSAVLGRRPGDAVALAMVGDPERAGDALSAAALEDRAGSFIVTAHLIKTSQAAIEEAAEIGSPLPLAATARYLAAPRLERFVARNVAESIDFVRTGRPPRR